jgi:hypothetical protein
MEILFGHLFDRNFKVNGRTIAVRPHAIRGDVTPRKRLHNLRQQTSRRVRINQKPNKHCVHGGSPKMFVKRKTFWRLLYYSPN